MAKVHCALVGGGGTGQPLPAPRLPAHSLKEASISIAVGLPAPQDVCGLEGLAVLLLGGLHVILCSRGRERGQRGHQAWKGQLSFSSETEKGAPWPGPSIAHLCLQKSARVIGFSAASTQLGLAWARCPGVLCSATVSHAGPSPLQWPREPCTLGYFQG